MRPHLKTSRRLRALKKSSREAGEARTAGARLGSEPSSTVEPTVESTVESTVEPHRSETLLLAFRLRDSAALVIGEDVLAARRVELLLSVGARTTVVAERPCAKLQRLMRDHGIEHLRRPFRAADLAGQRLAFVTLDDIELATEIVQLCRAAAVPVNSADRPGLCDFYLAASYREGPLHFALSTEGLAPGLAVRLRDQLAAALPAAAPAAILAFSRLRKLAKALYPGAEQVALRGRILSAVARTWSVPAIARLDARRSRVLLQAAANEAGSRKPGPAGALGSAAGAPPSNARRLPMLVGPPRARGRLRMVGAGPGAPELLSLAALRALREADLVLADRLIPDAILRLVSGELRVANKRKGNSHDAQRELLAWMLEGLRKGQDVVRLKCGDPGLFGRLGQELAAAQQAGFEAEIIPGVSSVVSAAAALGIPLTQRGLADHLLVCSGQGADGCTPELPVFRAQTTYVFLMALRPLEQLGQALQRRGFPAELPAVCISRIGSQDQRSVRAPLARLPAVVRAQELRAPATIIIGQVAGDLASAGLPAAYMGPIGCNDRYEQQPLHAAETTLAGASSHSLAVSNKVTVANNAQQAP
ncbi:MAG: SAM-dependent methyltransferase [Proteobacteria bacterium]|nr:SAM-dependent methyltransferase [Pseudomonadota bacterium]